MRYTFDNSADNVFNPNHPPQRVTYGLRSTDEMGDLTLQVLPTDPADLQTLLRDVHHKWLQQEIQGHQMLLRADPSDFEDHHTLAMYFLQVGRRDSAFAHFSQTLRLHPRFPEARVNYAIALVAEDRNDEAIEHFRLALKSRPEYSMAHFNLGLALHAAGRPREARTHFSEAARLRPEMAESIRSTVARLPAASPGRLP